MSAHGEERHEPHELPQILLFLEASDVKFHFLPLESSNVLLSVANQGS